jgi:hypothetical protein
MPKGLQVYFEDFDVFESMPVVEDMPFSTRFKIYWQA